METIEPDTDGHHAQTLIVASMSANLTRAGWWEGSGAKFLDGRRIAGDRVSDQAASTAFQRAGAA